MKPTIDDLPVLLASALRARGLIGRETTSTAVRFDDSGVEFVVEVTSKKFPRCGGDWSLFRCHCGRRCQKLRLFEGRPTCAHCIRATGMRYRTEMFSHASKRVAQTAPKRIERLTSTKPMRPGRMLDGRLKSEFALRRSLIVARQFAIGEHDKQLTKMSVPLTGQNANPLPSGGLDETGLNIHTDPDMRQSKIT